MTYKINANFYLSTLPVSLSLSLFFVFIFCITQHLRLHWMHNSSALQLLSLSLHVHGNFKVPFFFFYRFIISDLSLFSPTSFLPPQCSHRPNLCPSSSFLNHPGSTSAFLLIICCKVSIFLLETSFSYLNWDTI